MSAGDGKSDVPADFPGQHIIITGQYFLRNPQILPTRLSFWRPFLGRVKKSHKTHKSHIPVPFPDRRLTSFFRHDFLVSQTAEHGTVLAQTVELLQGGVVLGRSRSRRRPYQFISATDRSGSLRAHLWLSVSRPPPGLRPWTFGGA